MKKLSLLLAAAACFSFVPSSNNPALSGQLNGSWTPVKQEMNGVVIQATSFASHKMTLIDSNYVVKAESVDKGIVRYKNGKMDIFGKDGVNAGKHFTAIYKLEADQLTICYNLAGTSYPASFSTKSQTTYFMSTYKKDKVMTTKAAN